MRIKESALDIMRVFLRIGATVVNSVISGPKQDWLLKCERSKKQVEDLKDGMRFVGAVGIIAVVAGSDAKARQKIHAQ